MKPGAENTQPKHDKVLLLEEKLQHSEQRVQSLEQQLDWFKRQLFGRKSEKRLMEPDPMQPLLDGFEVEPAPTVEADS